MTQATRTPDIIWWDLSPAKARNLLEKVVSPNVLRQPDLFAFYVNCMWKNLPTRLRRKLKPLLLRMK